MTDRASTPAPEHVRLRPVQISDLPTLFLNEQDPESNRMAVANPRDAAAFRLAWERNLSDQSVIAKAILLHGGVVGTISCFKWEGLNSVGYWIAREHWGKGIASRALSLLLEEVSHRPLHARVARTNAASLRVLEKCGFRITGHQWAPATERFPACEEAILVLD